MLQCGGVDGAPVSPPVMAKSSSRPWFCRVMASKRRGGLGWAYPGCFGVGRSFLAASGVNGSSSQLWCVTRCPQGSSDDEKAMGGDGSSSTSLMPSIAMESPETRAQLCARVAALRVEITTDSATIYREKSTDS
jgi:hypothetical protein